MCDYEWQVQEAILPMRTKPEASYLTSVDGLEAGFGLCGDAHQAQKKKYLVQLHLLSQLQNQQRN